MAYLYQEIMNVPGLSGTWQNRNRQLYEKLGSPLGKYTGNYDQNIYLLNQLKKNNYYKSGLPGTTAKKATTPAKSLSSQYSEPGVEAGKNVSNTPTFSEVLPFYDAWAKLEPTASAVAGQQIDPEINRTLRKNMREYMGQLASTGGGRFGRAMGGVGSIQAQSSRDRSAQLSDWVNQYRKGFEDIFYNPSEQAWTKAITSGKKGTVPTIPTWEDFAKQYSQSTGESVPTAANNLVTPTSPGSQYSLF